MAGYTRQSTFADGDTITAALFNNEYNQLLNAFSNTGGHKHDGTAAEGPVIGLIGDAGETSPNNKVLIDTTNNYIEFYVEVSSAPVQQLYIADGAIIPVTDSDIDLGTTSLRFKDTYTDTVTTTGNVSIGGDLTVTGSATISGNLTFGDADTDSINLAAEIDSDIIPNTDGTYDLGSATKEWQDLYIDGTANIDSLVADTADINGGTIDGATIATSDITVGAGKTLNVSAGTLTLADNQISGDKVEGGTIAATTITTLTSTTGNITNVNATTLDTTNIEVTNLKAKDGTAAGSIANTTGVVTLASSVLTTTDINGGTIDGATIGGTTAGAVTFTDLSDGTITIAGFADEDNMVSNSATLLPTQQSVKAYVDSQVTAQDLDFQGDTGGALSIDLDSESLTIAGGTGIDTVGSGNTVTVNIDSTVATLTGTQTLTNKTLTSPDVNTPDIDGGTIDSSVIGGTTPAAGTFTTLTANTSITGTLATAAQPNITSLGTLTGLTTTGDINLGDNDKAVFGASSDLQIYHSGTNSIISEQGTGVLEVRTNGTEIQLTGNSGTDYMARFISNGKTQLHYDGSAKLATTSTGIDVTGTVTADGLTVDGNNDIQINRDGISAAKIFWNRSGATDAKIELAADENLNIGVDEAQLGGKNLIFRNNASEAMRIDSSGNVGIGTSSPNSTSGFTTLTLNNATTGGIIDFENNTSLVGRIYNTSTNFHVYNQTANSLLFGTGGSEKMRIDSSGQLRLGNTSPSWDTSFSSLVTKGGFVGSQSSLYIYSGQNVYHNGGLKYTTDGYSTLYEQSFGSHTFYNSASGTANSAITYNTALKIDNSGNVGIGTTNPSSYQANADDLVVATTGHTGITIASGTSHLGNIHFADGTSGDDAYRGFIQYEHTANYMRFATNASEAMRIDSSGNVGIGVTPSKRLDVWDAGGGNIASFSNGANADLLINCTSGVTLLTPTTGTLAFGTSSTERMRIDSSGQLLLGRSASVASGSEATRIQFYNTNSTYDTASIRSEIGAGQVNRGELVFAVNNGAGQQERVRLDYSGNVGIGTTSPSAKLHVVGSEVLFDNTGGDFTLKLNTNAVGDKNEIIMGDTSTPLAKFGVGGTANDIITGSDGQDFNIGTAGGGRAINFSTDNFASVEMKLDGGNLGIGTDSPDVPLYVQRASSGIVAKLFGENAYNSESGISLSEDRARISGVLNGSGGTPGASLRFYTQPNSGSLTERMRIDSSGSLLVGTTSQINSSTFSFDSGSSRGGIFENSATAAHTLQVQNTNASYADLGGGMLYINQSGGASVTGFRAISVYANSIARFAVRGDGTIFSQNTTVQSISDERFKENVKNLETGLSEVMNLKPRRFDWKEGRGTNQKNVAGFIAQEIETVLPDLVDEFKDGLEDNEMYKTVGYTGLIPTLVKAIQEQQTQIEALQSEINLLKGE